MSAASGRCPISAASADNSGGSHLLHMISVEQETCHYLLVQGWGLKGCCRRSPWCSRGWSPRSRSQWWNRHWRRAGAAFQQPSQGWAWDQPAEVVVQLELQPGPSAVVMASFACRPEQTSLLDLGLGFWCGIKLRGIFSVCKGNSIMFKVFGEMRMSAFLVDELLLF